MQETLSIAGSYSWGQFTPAFSLVGLAAAILMADCFLPKFPKRVYAIVAAIGCFIASGFMLQGEVNLFAFLAFLSTAACLLLAFDYAKVNCESIAGKNNEEGTGEFYALPLVAAAGIYCLTQAQDIVMLFVSLEIVTLTSYVLTGYFRRNQGSIEAGIKYFILGAMSTGILVFGAAWYFGSTGSFLLSTEAAAQAFGSSPAVATACLMAYAMLFAGAFFKVGAAPMHVWIPDVYQGAPTPTTAFLAVASKTAGFALLGSMAASLGGVMNSPLMVQAFAVVAAATLLIGNLGAMSQRNAKRLLGYSSIGQAGFIMVFFTCMTHETSFSVFAYLLAYTLATVAAFVAIAMLRVQRGSEEISAFRGLGKTNPRLAFLITVCFASLAGVPLTAGFLVKMASFLALIGAASCNPGLLYWMLPIMVVCAAAGFYYYFKVIRAMYWDKPLPEDKPIVAPACSVGIMIVCAVAILLMGSLPLIFIG